jgi:DNA-binding IclR family transcriptional regulator
VLDGADSFHGFRNQDVRARLQSTVHLAGLAGDPKKQSAKVSRILSRFHAHGLVAKIPRSRRWRTTRLGRRLMATAIQVREINFPQLLALAA